LENVDDSYVKIIETDEDLREIASRFDESVTDPKLRNSNFMKFIGKINKGKVEIALDVYSVHYLTKTFYSLK